MAKPSKLIDRTSLKTYPLASRKSKVDRADFAHPWKPQGTLEDFLERLPQDMVIQRLTGDPHPAELVAPLWSLKKAETLALIKETLEKRDTWQGKFYNH